MLGEILKFPKICDPRGNLTFLQNGDKIPFEIKRVYWIYDVPGGQSRGGHAFKKQQEIIIALSGSFDVEVSNGNDKRVISLNRSYYGFYIPAGIWRQMLNFSTNSVAMVLSSTFYDKADYIHDFDRFLEAIKS